MKKGESNNLLKLGEVKWSENFSLKIYVKVKKSESHILVLLSEVKWSEILSLNLHFRVKISESWISEKLSEVKWSKWASPSLHLHLSETKLSEFASLLLTQQKLENHYLHIKTSAYVNYAAVPISLSKAYKFGRPGNSHRQSCHNGSRLSNFSEEPNKILID